MDERMSIEEFENFDHGKSYFIEDRIVYEYPEVVMTFVDGSEKRQYFGTYAEAIKFKKRILSHCSKYIDHNNEIQGE